MKPRLCITGFCLVFAFPCIGQSSLDPTVISTAGGYDKTDEITLEWTIGEIAVATYSADGHMLTEGFHQPLLKVEDIELPGLKHADDLAVAIMPNPVRSILNIEITDPQKRILEFELIDAQGRLVTSIAMDTYVQNLQLNLSDYSAGFYVLRVIHPATRTLVDAFKVSKVN